MMGLMNIKGIDHVMVIAIQMTSSFLACFPLNASLFNGRCSYFGHVRGEGIFVFTPNLDLNTVMFEFFPPRLLDILQFSCFIV